MDFTKDDIFGILLIPYLSPIIKGAEFKNQIINEVYVYKSYLCGIDQKKYALRTSCCLFKGWQRLLKCVRKFVNLPFCVLLRLTGSSYIFFISWIMCE